MCASKIINACNCPTDDGNSAISLSEMSMLCNSIRKPMSDLRAYDYFGRKIGSHECEEAKIFIESQGWCTMAEIG
ncbi:MAG: hypothetical protein IIT83_02250, partial [Bacteroidales bacterium]|nr:hypothetical protein [Bacteroidales bacterium]